MDKLFKPKGRIGIRVYGQGFGDCILIALKHTEQSETFDYYLVDCGVFFSTEDKNDKLREVIANVAQSTGGKLNTLIVTHEHYDHVAGWHQTLSSWGQFSEVKHMWLAWTEDENDSLAQAIRGTITYKQKLAMGLQRMGLGKTSNGTPTDSYVQNIFELNVEKSVATETALKSAIEFAANRGATVSYKNPGQTIDLSPDCSFLFLGPPRDAELIKQALWKAGEPHMAFMAGQGEAAAKESEKSQILAERDGNLRLIKKARGYGLNLDEDDGIGNIRSALGLSDKSPVKGPFGDEYALDPNDSRWLPTGLKVKDAYYDPDSAFRKLDEMGKVDLGGLALQMDNLTNNTSLVFSIMLQDKSYLFVGDAQVGNWYGWYQQTYKVNNQTMTIEEVLARTVFYKVGHHGSHNATVLAKGLNKMPEGLVSIVPTEEGVYNGVPETTELMIKLNEKGPTIRTDMPERRAPFKLGPKSLHTKRALYVDYCP